MTPLTMADSTKAEELPDGYDAYLAYVDGEWVTASEVKARFPHKPVVTLTVLGGDAVADGCDREPGDLSAATAVEWVARRLEAGADRPIMYASVSNMAPVLSGLASAAIARHKVRLLSAHYLAGRHICGPASCGLMSVNADGTQWTDSARGSDGTRIDASLLLPDFFGPPSLPAWQEHMMQELPEVREGSTGPAVRTVQALCVARDHVIAVDGNFGPVTAAAVTAVQRAAKIADDGVCGPQTYPVLLGVALPAPHAAGPPPFPGRRPFSYACAAIVPAKGTRMTEPTPEPVPAPEPAPAASAEPHEGFLQHIESWWKQHGEPVTEDLTGAVKELEQANGLHAQNAASLAKLASRVLAVLKEVAPSSPALPEIEAVVEDIARIAGELATVL